MVQEAHPYVAPPPGWRGTTARAGEQELGLYAGADHVPTGAPLSLLATLRNVGSATLELQRPCGHTFQLAIIDRTGAVVYDWTAEQYPPRPGQPAAPPCPLDLRPLPAGEGLQVAFTVTLSTPGPALVHVSRFGRPGPTVSLEVAIDPR